MNTADVITALEQVLNDYKQKAEEEERRQNLQTHLGVEFSDTFQTSL